jgi:probable rRNA maturation factor
MRAQRVLEDLDYDDLSEVSISLVQADEMAKLNWEYRKKEGPTNVLSFAQETKESHVLGDVVICTDRAEEDAKKLGYTNMEMVEYLLIHGILHLAGFNHDNPTEAEEMASRVDEIFNKFNPEVS